MSTVTTRELNDELLRLSAALDTAVDSLKQAAHEYAVAESNYRDEKAAAWRTAPAGTVPEREAHVDRATAEERRHRNLAEGDRLGWLEEVRSRRQQLSALQSVAAAVRGEVELAGRGEVVHS